MLKILVIEDHALVREGLVHLLRQLEDDVSVFEVAEAESGVKVLESEPDLDLVMLDLALPGVDGLTWLKIQRKRFPAIPIVVCSAYDDGATVEKVMRAGASGFVPKAYPADRLLSSLRQVLDGGIVDPSTAPNYPVGIDSTNIGVIEPPKMGRYRPKDFGLSKRQLGVLDLVVKGQNNAEIAALLGLSEGTVKIHVTAIFKALGVKNRTQALVAAVRHKIKTN